jgi:hypothetical protein
MRRLVPGLAMILIAATVMLLGTATPSWAHQEHSTAFSIDARTPHVDPASPGWEALALSMLPESPAVPWPLLAGGVLLAVTLCRRRTRRAIALALVLLLAVLCFEDGLHSVHHLGGQAKHVRCAIATATAHLSATAVDTAATADIVLPVVAVTIETSRTDPLARFLCPDQGRAPPSSIA